MCNNKIFIYVARYKVNYFTAWIKQRLKNVSQGLRKFWIDQIWNKNLFKNSSLFKQKSYLKLPFMTLKLNMLYD